MSDTPVEIRPPETLSPSKIDSWSKCPQAFRFETIDKRPSWPAPAAERGTLVHAVLEDLMLLPPESRRIEIAHGIFGFRFAELKQSETWADMALTQQQKEDFYVAADACIDRYFDLEDPTKANPVGVEVMLATDHLPGVRMRGILDRLDYEDGRWIVVDYKSGAAPKARYLDQRMTGMRFYAMLLWRNFGVVADEVRLVYLGGGEPVVGHPTVERIEVFERHAAAVWGAIKAACRTGNFPTRTGPLCDWCSYKPICPAWTSA